MVYPAIIKIHMFLIDVKEEFIMPEYTAWITAQIQKICKTYKNRTAGSESVRDCMHAMKAQLLDWCDDVAAEPFTLHPHAFMGSVPLQASLCICGVICFLLSYLLSSAAAAWISAVLFLAAISVWLLEYVFYGRAFILLLPSSRKSSAKPPENGSESLSGAGTLPCPRGAHTAAHRGEHGGSLELFCAANFCCTR